MKFSQALEWLKNQKINRGVVLIKLFSFSLNFSVWMIFPYLTLQMINIGLSYEDVSLIYGTIPAFTFFTSPVAGFIGDKIGYKPVLLVNLVMAAVSATCFDLTPRFHERVRIPSITYGHANGDHVTMDQEQVFQLTWPLLPCSTSNVTVDDCLNSFPNTDDSFWTDLNQYLACDDNNITLSLPVDISSVNLTRTDDGFFCQATTMDNEYLNATSLVTTCEFSNHPNVSACYETEGSRAATFGVYFALRMVFQITMISCYAAVDGTALRQVKEFNSDYSFILIYSSLAAGIAPLIASVVIKDAPEGSGEENDYSIAFWIMDGGLALTFLIATRLKITMGFDDGDNENKKQKRKEMNKALKYIFTPSACIFYGLVFFNGLLWGVHDTYITVYLQENLNAPSSQIGYLSTVSLAAGLVILPFAKWIIKTVGHINIVYAALMAECGRLVIFSLVEQSPPNYAYGLSVMDFLIASLGWTSCMSYTYLIAPPLLVGTMAALTGSVNWIIAKGISSLVAGQLVANTSLSIQDVFQVSALFCFIGATIFFLAYHIIGKKYEKELVAKNEAQRLAQTTSQQTKTDVELVNYSFFMDPYSLTSL